MGNNRKVKNERSNGKFVYNNVTVLLTSTHFISKIYINSSSI